MKKVLFVCASMKVGGAEKSLVNLFNMLDFNLYDVSLLLLQNQGQLINQLPDQLKIIRLPENARQLYDSNPFSLKRLYFLMIKYLSTGIEKVLWKQYDVLRAHRWKDFYLNICEPLPYFYDAVIAFQSGECTYYAFDKIKAARYVTFFHTDIRNIKLDRKIELEYLKKADLIATISPKCVESIKYYFNEVEDKVVCLENLSSSKLINQMAGDTIPNEYMGGSDFYIIVSVGRLNEIKGYDMVIDAAEVLKNEGIKFQWFVIGEGKERKKLELQIKNNKVEKYVHLIGLRTNPYPYMKFANLVVQSSRYEGKSVVLDEAKILGKQILVTNYSSAKDQITDGVDGYICDMNANAIALGVKRIMDCPIEYNQRVFSDDSKEYMNVLLGEDV